MRLVLHDMLPKVANSRPDHFDCQKCGRSCLEIGTEYPPELCIFCDTDRPEVYQFWYSAIYE